MTRHALVLVSLAAVGCYDVHSIDPGHAMVPILTDSSGWVRPEDNPFALSGHWYSYGDQYFVIPRCTELGLHPADEGEHAEDQCSFVGWPVPELPPVEPVPGVFPAANDRLCTYGNVAKVNDCFPDTEEWCPNGKLDYANMWGSGIGLQFDLDVYRAPEKATGTSTVFNAVEHGIVGIAYDFEWNDPSAMPDPFVRVEFPIVLPPEGLTLPADTVDLEGNIYDADDSLPEGSTSEIHPSGSPFLDAPARWGTGNPPLGDPSGVVVGHNEVTWSEVYGPSNDDDHAYAFHPESLVGIQFHVPAIDKNRIPYGFCVSNLAFLTK